jgi:hypothetical protein
MGEMPSSDGVLETLRPRPGGGAGFLAQLSATLKNRAFPAVRSASATGRKNVKERGARPA